MEKFAYLIWTIFFAVIWLVFMLKRKDLARESITMGIIIGVMAPFVDLWHLRDYWHPDFLIKLNIFNLTFGLEDIILAFFIGAISSIVFEVVFRKKLEQQKKPFKWQFPFLILSVLYFLAVAFLLILKINSIYAGFLSAGIGIIVFSALRKDLIWGGFVSGILFSAILFLSYVLWLKALFPGIMERWWYLKNLSGILVLGVPVEEIIWGFLWGWIAGIIYEINKGLVEK